MYKLVTDVDNNTNQPQNPKTNANIFELLTFGWLLDLFKKGRKKDLEECDLYATLNDHKSSSLGDELEKKWKSELAIACKERRSPSLLRALFRMFGPEYMLCGFNHFVGEIILRISQPLFIGGLLTYFNPASSNKTNVEYAYVCAFGLVFSTLASVVLYHLTEFNNVQCGMKIRVSCCSVIYRKALRLSHAAIGETTVGTVINLLSNDVNRFDVALTFLHFLWIGPLQTVIITYFLWREIGVSSILGIAALFFFIPLQGWLGKKMSEIRTNVTGMTDERLRLMSEIISGIQVIKMYTWEKPFSKLVEYARKKEIGQIRRYVYVKTILMTFILIQTKIQMFLSILAYVLFGNYITAQKVFVVTSFYNVLALTMTLYFCHGLGQIAEMIVSVKRIQSFLLLEEKDGDFQNVSKSEKRVGGTTNSTNELIDENCTKNNIENNNAMKSSNGFRVVVAKATAKWTNDHAVNALVNVDLTAKPNRLVAIIGPVGAGKSSLIQAILRELPLSEGEISVRGVVSYASQDPWLFSGSIRQNILFDSPMNVERYKQVIKACALENDFKQLPYGDRTTVGERGVTLSGGQKARINLARTVYKQADIYLLDDPLSAVDTRVGKHLFNKCVQGYLKEKTCILVTHQIQYLTNVDQIVLMKNGSVLAEGSYRQLQMSGIDFANVLGSVQQEETRIESEIDDSNYNSYHKNGFDHCGSSESIMSYKHNGAGTEPNEDVEYRYFGRVAKSVYASYFSSIGSTLKTLFCLFALVVTQVLMTGSDYWICFWVNQEEYVFRSENVTRPDETPVTAKTNTTNTSMPMTSNTNLRAYYVTIYTVLIVSVTISIAVKSAILVSAIVAASENLHKTMFDAIIRATMNFFNTNSSGRIFNRFSKDIGAIDDILPFTLLDCLQILSIIFGIVFIVGLINVYLMLPTFIVVLVFYRFREFYIPASRSIKRLEGTTRSPVFAHLNASIQGLTTIRAYKAERILTVEFDKCQDSHTSAWYLFISSNEAFGLWLDMVCLIYISIVIFSFIIIGKDVYGGNVGLVINQTIGITGMVQWGIRQTAVLENQMTSVERVLEYTNSPQESALRSPPDKTPPKEWPEFGEIVFKNLSLRYSQDGARVLKNLSFVIRPMEKVGIVGRTGAGKSSVIAALFRLAVNDGDIFVDDVEIHGLGLHDLRSKISIIPQEPVLFSGTMRTNLDPFDEYPDHALWKALDEVQLKPLIENLPDGLNSKMSESGSNFSIGQRQLVCLARAVLRNNKILLLDEATANVDPQTDALIQNTIRNKFRTCTVLTIAHRLNTVMDSDRILIMDAGRMVEFDHPYNLLRLRENGYLYKMVEQTGRTAANFLHDVATESYNATHAEKNASIRFIDEDDVEDGA